MQPKHLRSRVSTEISKQPHSKPLVASGARQNGVPGCAFQEFGEPVPAEQAQ